MLKELGNDDREVVISTHQLCDYLRVAETRFRSLDSLYVQSIAPGIKKRKRSETPPEEITSSDEARYAEQEERTAKRIANGDPDYETEPSGSSSQ